MSRRNWLIIALIVLAIILVTVFLTVGVPILFYTGISNPQTLNATENQVWGLSVISVKNFELQSDGRINLYIVNEAPDPIKITDIKIGNSSIVVSSPQMPLTLQPSGESTIVGKTSMAGKNGEQFYNITIEMNYSLIGGNEHIDSGLLRGHFS